MNEQLTRFVVQDVPYQEVKTHPLEKLLTFAQARSVYSEPVTVGDHTIITACEMTAILGYGYGPALGAGPNDAHPHNGALPETNGAPHESPPANGSTGQGGGGGTAFARPVAVINIGPEGVWVDPVVDVAKISLAAFAMAGTVARAVLRAVIVPAPAPARSLFRRKAVARPGKRMSRALSTMLRRPARRKGLLARFARPRRTPPLRLVITQVRALIPAPPAARRRHA